MEEAVALERDKWLEEESKAWEGRRDGLLQSAHKQWSLAQEPLHRVALEQARKEGLEEGMRLAAKEHKVIIWLAQWSPMLGLHLLQLLLSLRTGLLEPCL